MGKDSVLLKPIKVGNVTLKNRIMFPPQTTGYEERDGSIGEANAHMDQRIQVSAANSTAIEGENEAKIKIAMSDAALKEKQAEAMKIAVTAEKIQAAKAREEAYAAEEAAEAQEELSKELQSLCQAAVLSPFPGGGICLSPAP